MKNLLIIILVAIASIAGYKYMTTTEPEITNVQKPDFTFGKLEGISEWNVASQEVTVCVEKQLNINKSFLSLDLSLSEIFGKRVSKDKGCYVFVWKGGWNMAKSQVTVTGNQVIIQLPDFQINSIEPQYLKEVHNYNGSTDSLWFKNRKYITPEQQARLRAEITEEARKKIIETQFADAKQNGVTIIYNYLIQINPNYRIVIK